MFLFRHKKIRKLLKNLGEGIFLYTDSSGAERTLFNSNTEKWHTIIDKERNMKTVTDGDIDWDVIKSLSNGKDAYDRKARNKFTIETFQNGVALVVWTLCEAGSSFESEYSNDANICKETNIYSFISSNGVFLVPFRDMKGEDFRMYRKVAENINRKRKKV